MTVYFNNEQFRYEAAKKADASFNFMGYICDVRHQLKEKCVLFVCIENIALCSYKQKQYDPKSIEESFKQAFEKRKMTAEDIENYISEAKRINNLE